MITSTLDSKAVNKILSTWLEIPVAVIKREKRHENTKAFTAAWNKRNWRFTSPKLSYKSSARELWGIQRRYTLIAQTQSRLLLPTCSSHHSKHEPTPRRVSDLSRPAFILVLASSVVSGQRLSVCTHAFHTHFPLPLKGVRGVNRSKENACNNTDELGFFFSPK